MSACAYAINRHPQELNEQAALIFGYFGKGNYMELFTFHLKYYFKTKNKYVQVIHDLFITIAETSLAKEVLF